jgi:hypothetical protein
MIQRIKTTLVGVPVILELRLKPDKDSIAELIGQGIDVEDLRDRMALAFLEIATKFQEQFNVNS